MGFHSVNKTNQLDKCFLIQSSLFALRRLLRTLKLSICLSIFKIRILNCVIDCCMKTIFFP